MRLLQAVCGGTYTNTWVATDVCANTSTVFTQIITITDNTPPVWTTAADALNISVECGDLTALNNAQLLAPSAVDACGTVTNTKISGSFVAAACGGTYTNTWTAIDGCGNISVVFTQVITIIDVTPPLITASGTTNTLGCNPTPADINAALGTATATDACGAVTITSSDVSTTVNCTVTLVRTFTAVDGCGNNATTSRTVTWTSDLTPPSITATGTTTTLACNPIAADINAALGTATATDACGAVTITSSDAAATIFWLYCNASKNLYCMWMVVVIALPLQELLPGLMILHLHRSLQPALQIL